MKVPPNYTEPEVIALVEMILDKIASSFAFGIYDREDIRQEGWVEALLLLEKGKYDGVRPLEKLMYRHICNRLMNLKRNKFYRPTAPCKRCEIDQPCPNAPAGEYCYRHLIWLSSNRAKASLMQPQPLPELHTETDSLDDLAQKEFYDLIDKELPAPLRSIWLRIRDGVIPTRHKREVLEKAIRGILLKHRERITGISEEEPLDV